MWCIVYVLQLQNKLVSAHRWTKNVTAALFHT